MIYFTDSIARPLFKVLPGLVLIILLQGCSTNKKAAGYIQANNSYCVPATIYHYEKEQYPLSNVDALIDSTLRKKYSTKSLLIANGVGILNYLQELNRLERGSEKYLLKKSEITTHLMLASTEIASLAAELDCEGERADLVADYLTEKENRFIKKMTVTSIVVGALAAVITTILPNQTNDDLGKTIAIGGGTASAVLGLSTLFYNRKVSFTHSRNLLADIWNKEKSSAIYSPVVWYMFNEKAFSNDQQSSIRANIRSRWESYYPGLAENEKIQQLFFGSGGLYSREELRSRASMLNQVQASVNLINQDLQTLMMELSLH